MDTDRADNAVEAFRRAEGALTELIEDANELTESASSLREANEDVKTLAEALGIASKQWADIAVAMKDVSAEIQAASRLLQKAEPQELHEAVDENTTSIGELQTVVTGVQGSLEELGETSSLLVTRVESISETTINLRVAVVAKLDLLQSSTDQARTDSERAAKDAEKSQEKTREALSDATENMKREVAVSNAVTQSSLKTNLIVTSLAVLLALVAVVLLLVR